MAAFWGRGQGALTPGLEIARAPLRPPVVASQAKDCAAIVRFRGPKDALRWQKALDGFHSKFIDRTVFARMAVKGAPPGDWRYNEDCPAKMGRGKVCRRRPQRIPPLG